MGKFKIIAAAVIVLAVTVAGLAAYVIIGGKKQEGYVFDRNSKIGEKNVRVYLVPGEFKAENVKDYFKEGSINSFTLRYFLFLDDKFKDVKNSEDRMKAVREYLYTVMPTRDEADRLFAVYRTYTKYQQDVVDRMKSWGAPSTQEDAIDYLHKLQDYRREVFGRETADALFGPVVKVAEYQIRRSRITEDKDLYSDEKENMIDDLKEDMWGGEADNIDSYTDSLTRYYEKLDIYHKDMAEMKTDDERQAMVRQIREELFTPEQIQRLEDVDRQLADEKRNEEDYFAREKKIKNDATLSADGKARAIYELQDRMFGSEADAFRRRLAVEHGRQ